MSQKKSSSRTTQTKKKSQKRAKLYTEKINLEKWPQERNVFFRPNRMKYVRKMDRPIGCVFCRSAAQKNSIETLCVFKTKHSQIVLNKYPYNTGHLLVLPLRHTGDLLSLTNEEYQDLHMTLRHAVEAVQSIYSPSAFNLGLNHGVHGGAGLPDHLHYHIVPRWQGDLNFFPLIAETKVVIENLEDSYAKLYEYFNLKKSLTE